jgi:hypothetical protein
MDHTRFADLCGIDERDLNFFFCSNIWYTSCIYLILISSIIMWCGISLVIPSGAHVQGNKILPHAFSVYLRLYKQTHY